MSNYQHLLNERQLKALELREKGFTFAAIGKELNVGVEGARGLVTKAKRILNSSPNDWPELSVRTQNVLKVEGLHTKEQIVDAIKTGKLTPKKRGYFLGDIPNYGKKSHQEVCDWLNIKQTGEQQ
jgi:DNA-directed RNA polymerase alpha subunit